MNKIAGYLGLAITVLGVLLGAAMSWQRLLDRVDNLERKERYEHGTYALPSQER